MTPERGDRVVRRFVLVAMVLPAAVVVAGLVIQLAALPHVAARIPLNPAGVGAATGALPTWVLLVVTVALGFGLPAVFALSSLPSLRRGERAPGFRLFGSQALGLSVLLTTVATSGLLENAGVKPTGEDGLWIALATGLVAGVVAAFGGWFLQRDGSRATPATAVTPLDLTSSQRAVWLRTAYLPVPAIAVICAVVAILGTKAGFGWADGDRDGIGAILTAVAVLLLALLAATAVFRVRIDASGVSIRSALGVPRFRVELADVGAVAVVDARSLGVAGSWGIRVFRERVLVVMRSTAGIRVTRRDGRVYFVTVDDAARGAALLEALIAKTRKEEPLL